MRDKEIGRKSFSYYSKKCVFLYFIQIYRGFSINVMSELHHDDRDVIRLGSAVRKSAERFQKIRADLFRGEALVHFHERLEAFQPEHRALRIHRFRDAVRVKDDGIARSDGERFFLDDLAVVLDHRKRDAAAADAVELVFRNGKMKNMLMAAARVMESLAFRIPFEEKQGRKHIVRDVRGEERVHLHQ